MNPSNLAIQNSVPSYLLISSAYKEETISRIMDEHRVLMELDSTDILLFKSKEHQAVISLLFNHITQNEQISFGSFLRELIDYKIKQHITNKHIQVNFVNFNSIQIEPILAVSLAIFAYEIIHNSFLYAFTNVESPSLTFEWDKSFFKISDNGSGFIPMINSASKTSEKSLFLLKFIANQLRAKLLFQQKGGSSIAISLQESIL